MRQEAAMVRVIAECRDALSASRLDDIAPAILIDELLDGESLEGMEADGWLGPVWRFVEAFFDAAAHRFPDVGEGLTIARAEEVLSEVQEALARGDRTLRDDAWAVVRRFR